MTIKQLTWRLVIPASIVSFATITKWWYVLPVDAPDTMMVGFPLAFVADGWFTSMSLQFFLLEFLVDFLSYFLLCLLLVVLLSRFLKPFNVSKGFTRAVWAFAIVATVFWCFIFSISENHFKIKRDWNLQVLATGFKFTWANKQRPEFSHYDPARR